MRANIIKCFALIYTLIEFLYLFRVVRFLHGQLCPLGNTVNEGQHYQMFRTSMRANIIKCFALIYTLIEFLYLFRVVRFLHGQLCPLGNTNNEGQHCQLVGTDLHFQIISITD